MIDTSELCATAREAELSEEIDRLRAELTMPCSGCGCSTVGTSEWLLRRLATARALAMEEAAQWAQAHCCGESTCEEAKSLRALAPLPAGLVVVPRKTLAEALLLMQHATEGHTCLTCGRFRGPDRQPGKENHVPGCRNEAMVAALSALVKP